MFPVAEAANPLVDIFDGTQGIVARYRELQDNFDCF